MGHVTFEDRPKLDSPPVICAFKGWNDGGEAASLAAGFLSERWGGTPFAHLEPDEFYDFQVTRPTVRLEGGVSRVIDWPRGSFACASVSGRDVVVFNSIEPNLKWRSFAEEIIDVARSVGSELLVTLGAFLADVPHTRPVPVVGSAQDEETAERLGLSRSQYEGPTGIVGVLHDASNRAGLTSVSLWAAVPHYLPISPNPKAALALVEQTAALLDIPVESGPLDEAVATWQAGVSRLLGENEELSEYVGRLEAAAGEMEQGLGDGPVPSGDSIAAELERYLREQGGSS